MVFSFVEIEVVFELHPHRDLMSVLGCRHKLDLARRSNRSLSQTVRKSRNSPDIRYRSIRREHALQHDRSRNLVLARVFSVLRLRLRNQTCFSRDVFTRKDPVITATATAAWSTTAVVTVAAADVATAAWYKNPAFTRSDTPTRSRSATASS